MSTNWVKCTAFEGGPVYINLGKALSMRRIATTPGQEHTRIYFSIGTGANDGVSVQEVPDTIISMAGA
jgi:hypothetical protein